MREIELSIKKGNVLEALRVAMPLIIAASGHAIKLFMDRMMLAHYSGYSLAASLSAGVLVFMLMSLWLGAAGYASSFVAQYTGAGRKDRVGPAIWQGAFLGLFGGMVVACGYFFAEPLFNWLDHEPAQKADEITYFRILCPGSIPFIIHQGLLGFWNGRGKTWAVTALEVFSTGINFIFNYILIFGGHGLERIGISGYDFEPMGIAGAAWGTNIAGISTLCLTIFLLMRRKNREEYNTWPRKKFDYQLFKRLLSFGLPSGIHFVLDVASFSIFIQLLSGMSKEISIASSIAFSVNLIAFIPMTGLGMTAGIFVGQAVGAGRIDLAKRAVRSCLYIILAYMWAMGILFVCFPEIICGLFPMSGIDDPAQVAHIYELAHRMLMYMALFLLFDGMFILYNMAIKGAGDTKFAMWVGVGMAWLLFAIPSYVALHFFDAEVWTLWKILVGYIIIAGFVFYARYRRGKWQRMRVIEEHAEEN